MKKQCYILTMEYYSAVKKNELVIHTIQMNLRCITSSERSHTQKKNCMEIWDGFHLGKQAQRNEALFTEVRTQPLGGPAVEFTAGKKKKYAKIRQRFRENRPLASSTKGNSTTESGEWIRQHFTVAVQGSSLLPLTQLFLIQLTSPELELCLDYKL